MHQYTCGKGIIGKKQKTIHEKNWDLCHAKI